jgi:NAD(P)-dependent dehydrogenase (short-subunit alcohol dehydrogenase family)
METQRRVEGMRSLAGKVAVVAGATRGAGRGIARMLGAAGATVYCAGRSSRAAGRAAGRGATPFELRYRPETIEETAELVAAEGGVGIPLRTDFLKQDEAKALFDRVQSEQGKLDILVNDVWGGDELAEWGKPFWELDLAKGLRMQELAVHAHIISSRYGAPAMVARRRGLIVEITDGVGPRYRGNLFYDLAKASAIRLALGMAQELRPYNVAAVAVTPGFLRSEAMLEHFGVTEANWRDGAKRDPHFIASETPVYIGRAIAALAADPHVLLKSGGAYSSWGLAREYGFSDADGGQPNWGEYFEKIDRES